MPLKKNYILLLLTLINISCSGGQSLKYKDTKHLEEPPRMELVDNSNLGARDEVIRIRKGLGNSVAFVDKEDQSIIKIKKTFDRSWEIIEQALKLNETEITDKNRGTGLFYVTYRSENKKINESSLIDRMTFHLFTDDYYDANYKLTVVWQENNTEVTAERVSTEDSDLLDDNEDALKGHEDNGKQLLKSLYKTIRDDLKIS